jgi:hypothetical protein
MKRYINRHVTDILYAVAFVGMALIIFLLFMLNIKTDNTVVKTHDELVQLQKNIERDHDNQDRLLSCLVDLFANQQHPSDEQLNGCVAKTRIGQTSARGTAPASQASGPATPGSGESVSSSSSQYTAPAPAGQSNNPQPTTSNDIPIITPVVNFVTGLLP